MTAVVDDIEAIFERAGATGFLHAREITADGPEVSVGGDDPVVLASVFKILVLTAYVRAVEAGTIDPAERTTITKRYRVGGIGFAGFSHDAEASWADLALNMMIMSDNAATDVLFHRLGNEAVQQVIADLGLTQTLRVGACEDLFASLLEDLADGAPSDDIDAVIAAASVEQVLAARILDPLRTAASTPRDVTKLLAALWTDAAATPAASATARGIMAQQIWPHRLSSGFPEGVQIAAKTGTVPTWRNEAGVVTYPDGRQFAVAVFTRAKSAADRQPSVDASIGAAAFAAIEHLRSLP